MIYFREVAQLQWDIEKKWPIICEMTLMYLLIIEVFKWVRGINLSYLNDIFINPSSNYDGRNSSRLLKA